MSKRLQVLLSDEEYRELERFARQRRVTVSEWARQALRAAKKLEPGLRPDRKLAAVRAAAKHSFPAPGIETMLEEIESGYQRSAEE